MRGYWWAPDGERVVVARVDESPVRVVHRGPGQPGPSAAARSATRPRAPPTPWYGSRVVRPRRRATPVEWDRDGFPYLVNACWPARIRSPFIVVQSRDQRRVQILEVADPATGATTVVREDADPVWVDIHQGVPAWLADGRMVWLAPTSTTRGGCSSTPRLWARR